MLLVIISRIIERYICAIIPVVKRLQSSRPCGLGINSQNLDKRRNPFNKVFQFSPPVPLNISHGNLNASYCFNQSIKRPWAIQTRAKTRLVLRDLNAVSVQKYGDPFICKNNVQQNGHHYRSRDHHCCHLHLCHHHSHPSSTLYTANWSFRKYLGEYLWDFNFRFYQTRMVINTVCSDLIFWKVQRVCLELISSSSLISSLSTSQPSSTLSLCSHLLKSTASLSGADIVHWMHPRHSPHHATTDNRRSRHHQRHHQRR